MPYYVYFLKDENGLLYIGQTNNLEKREKQHNSKSSSSAKYTREGGTFNLVYSEEYETRTESMRREKQLKTWTRARKELLMSKTK